jgi:hypothetical protein
MDIKDFKQLKQVINLCRKTGVSDIEIAGIKMHIGPITDYGAKRVQTQLTLDPTAGVAIPSYSPVSAQETQDEVIKTFDNLSDEDRLFYSSRPEPQ